MRATIHSSIRSAAMCWGRIVSPLARLGTVVLAIGLLGLGVGALVLPEWSAQTYGVPVEQGAWVQATGLRDLVLGLVLLALLPSPTALRRILPLVILLPLGDVAIVLLDGQPLAATAPHAVGTLAIAILAGLVWRR